MRFCTFERAEEGIVRCSRNGCDNYAYSTNPATVFAECKALPLRCVFQADNNGTWQCVRGGCDNSFPNGTDVALIEVECKGGRPGKGSLAKNYIEALGRHIVGGGKRRTDEEIAAIKTICQENRCELYNAIGEWCEHKSCGCRVDRKAAWLKEVCPMGFWK